MLDPDLYEQTEEVSENELDVWVKPGGKRISVNRHPDNVAHAKKLNWALESDVENAKNAKAKEGGTGKKEPAKTKDGDDDNDDEPKTEEEKLRAKYEEIVGKPAHWNASKATMEAHIAKAKEGGE